MKSSWTVILGSVAMTASTLAVAQGNTDTSGSPETPANAAPAVNPEPAVPPAPSAPTATVAPAATVAATPMNRLEAPAPEPVIDPGPPTLLGSSKPTLGGYGGISVMGSSMKGQGVVYVGGEGAVLVNHRLALGLAGYGLASRIAGPDDIYGAPQRLGFGYGGLLVRYSFVDRRPYYLTIGALVGGGGVTYHSDYDNHDFDDDLDEDRHPDALFVFEPSVGGHLNLTRWARLGMQVSYRVVSGIDKLTQVKEKDLSGFAYGGSVQLGWF